MLEELTIRRPGSFKRQRILEAAILPFSRHSYEATTLSDIAAGSSCTGSAVYAEGSFYTIA